VIREYQLFIGSKNTKVILRPDDDWPPMWHIHAPGGFVSGMLNLTRAREAAIARVCPKGIGDRVANWIPVEIGREAGYVAQNEGAARVAKAQFQNAPASREDATPAEMKAT